MLVEDSTKATVEVVTEPAFTNVVREAPKDAFAACNDDQREATKAPIRITVQGDLIYIVKLDRLDTTLNHDVS